MRALRWVIAIVALLAILSLLGFARGTPEHGEPTPPTGIVIQITA